MKNKTYAVDTDRLTDSLHPTEQEVSASKGLSLPVYFPPPSLVRHGITPDITASFSLARWVGW